MKTRVNLFILSILLVFVSSCGNDPQLKDGDTVYFPDTSAFHRNWNMNEHVFLDELFLQEPAYNELGLDTFELTYAMCDCPDWIDRTKGDLDCRECTEFYTEAADSSIRLPEQFLVNGNTVRFYGVLIPGYNLPHGKEFTTQKPEWWTVIRYYGYEVVHPYGIWGPQMKQFQEPSDTLEHGVILTIQ